MVGRNWLGGWAVRVGSLAIATVLLSCLCFGDELAELKQKAEAGDAAAALKLGQDYEYGKSVKADKFQAMDWYLRAAEAGSAEAQNIVGVKLRTGEGGRKDPSEAVSWYKKAARQGLAEAMFNLGTAFYNGDGVAIKDEYALTWFILAKEFGSKEAIEAVNRSLTEVRPNVRVAAISRAAEMMMVPIDVPAKPDSALQWLNKLVQEGDPGANLLLARMYLDGKGVPKNMELAFRYCEAGAKADLPQAMTCMGHLYRKGLGATQDSAAAANWYKRGAKCGEPVSMFTLSEMYGKGEGVKQDRVQQYALLLVVRQAVPAAAEALERVKPQLSPKEIRDAEKKALELVKTPDKNCNWEAGL